MARLLATPETVIAYSPARGLTPDDPSLALCLAAASAAIERRCRRILSAKTVTARHSGGLQTRAGRIYLADPATGFACAPVSGVTVSEAGVSLDVFDVQAAASPTDGEKALLNSSDGTLMRASVSGGVITPKLWALGFGNVLASCTAGYAIDAIPEDLQAVACELTWLIFNEGSRTGYSELAQAGVDMKFVRLLTPTAKDILDSYAIPTQPRTLAG